MRRLAGGVSARLARWPVFPYDVSVRVSLWVSVVVVAGLFGWGAWQRRWIADDGLIVLRTVRNLLAGNGPVFNAGERIEANTSTVWTYLVTLGAWLGGPVRLEYVALAFALTLSVLGVVLAMLGTGRLYAPSLQGRRALLLPAGALVYIAVPPARDFATSGLENGLVLAYLGLLWWMLVCWSQALRRPNPVSSKYFDAALAAVAGLSVLIRPELALIGGGALVMMLIAARGWRRRVLILVAGGLLPVAYQIFRMGYYGLLVPGTAVAKDASGSKWSQGFTYLTNFNHPYLLWVPVLLLAALGAVLLTTRTRPWWVRHQVPRGYGWLARTVQSPAAVVLFMFASGLLQGIYWVRQGGDFMHGRVLLTPLFCLLMPVSVIPVVLPDGTRFTRETGYLLAAATSVLWASVVGWSIWAANSSGLGADGTRVTYSGIVDERRFYSQATGHAHPLTAADYLDYPRMRAVLTAIENTPDGALLLPSGNYDQWDVVPAYPPPPDLTPEARRTLVTPHTVFFTNMGMLGMNVGLDVRVIDQIGLTNPLAMHTQRLTDGRIGHDKNLFPDWAVAEGPFLKTRPYIPAYLDEEWISQAQAALDCQATESMLNSVRGEMSPRRFLSNLAHAYEFTKYRIDRVPLYELKRCGLPVPEPKNPPYTGMPATGP
ncbi:flagellar motor control protein ZomB [Mycolicibacterium fortuitum]|uniref:Flagellar motor control protein ZomB n=1 Tax=Mycolicibacterium fortuitum TaxID=1766 RepID=A0AAE4VBA2_MYCFO|nr:MULTISPECIES: flagellar motor control protein ZomB [Mycolicibacterium]MDG5771348.1 flagellar motor control protein ZomB [Mycolicibacterium fortuitum]MDG5780653.1 flagellar motor control protein ZomB [Mycolicibacterium fortuitum]MDV7190851.1 flagellar motor control protein ZomB [Mycolicibacterium fortuitum]MDV7204057.1 flagellar motor control protein ZomB [Mycolicibacterium fortuitum]MDV7227165.1 flagellar motor control protein ZomB [Mycolicibacterium fortuitum]